MPYVNIPDSSLGGATAKIVGKIQGQITAQVIVKASGIANKLNKEGCPSQKELKRLRQQKQQLDSAVNSISNKLSKFRKLPKKLKAPLGGLKAALKLILSLPIPQSVPPGFGLPINITTKYADTMHLVKELIKQIDETIQAIEVVVDTPSTSLSSIDRILLRADNALKVCELELVLDEEIQKNNITEEELINTGLYDNSGNFNLQGTNRNFFDDTDNSGRTFKGKWLNGIEYFKDNIVNYKNEKWVCLKDHTSDIDGGKQTGPPGVGPWKTQSNLLQESSNSLLSSLKKLDDSNISKEAKDSIKDTLNIFKLPKKSEVLEDSNFFHTGPDGQVYVLEILNDPDSPSIAPRRFAIATTQSGVVKFRGSKSFSSSTEVLLKEIKFRIDNQLP